MRKTMLIPAIIAGLVLVVLAGCEEQKVSLSDTAESLASVMNDANGDDVLSQHYNNASMAHLASMNEVPYGDADPEDANVSDLENSDDMMGGEGNQWKMVAYALYVVELGNASGSFTNPNGTTTEYTVVETGNNVDISLYTYDYPLFVDHVNASVTVNTSGTRTDTTDDQVLSASYDLVMNSGASFSASADLGNFSSTGEVTIIGNVNNLPCIFQPIKSAQDTIVVDTNGTLDDETDDVLMAWSRVVVYNNTEETTQTFTLGNPSGSGPVVDTDNKTIMTILSENLPANCNLDNISDTI